MYDYLHTLSSEIAEGLLGDLPLDAKTRRMVVQQVAWSLRRLPEPDIRNLHEEYPVETEGAGVR